jgi:hypothetical protein
MIAVPMRSYRYFITARVQPERFGAGLGSSSLSVDLSRQFEGASVTLNILVRYAQVCVFAHATKALQDLPTFVHDLADTIRGVTDTIAFQQVTPYDIEIVSLFDFQTNSYAIVHMTVPNFAPAAAHPVSQEDLMREALVHPELLLALGDFRRALGGSADTGVFCYRAVEAITATFADGDRKAAWANMRATLRVHREWLQPLVDESTPRRHGAIVGITPEQRVDLLQRAWRFIYRYFEFLHNRRVLPDEVEWLGSPVS